MPITSHAALVVIGNPSLKINQLDKTLIAQLYQGNMSGIATDTPFVLYDQLSGTTAYQDFYRDILGWTAYQVDGYWSLISVDNINPRPKALDSAEEVVTMVSSTPGAIGYVETDQIQALKKHVKILYTISKENHNEQLLAELRTPVVQNDKTINVSSLWGVLATQFTLDEQAINQPQVQHYVQWYLHHPAQLQAMLNHARPYLYYVYGQIKERHLPIELTLLPIVESGYDPLGYSRVGAAGLWQMMPLTASSLGLKIDWWYDARCDIVISTQAALNYFVSLYNQFHSWLWVIAAYDAGPGAVAGAIEYNKKEGNSTDFWDLPLPREAQAYVPKLFALVEIIKHPDKYGVNLPFVPNAPYFVTIDLTSQMDLSEISRLSEVTPQTIQQLNPGMRRFATSPQEIYTLLVPRDHAKIFLDRLSQMVGHEHLSWEYHEVQPGETLEKIASDYHTSVPLLMKANRLKTPEVRVEQGIVVPLRLHQTFKLVAQDITQDLKSLGEPKISAMPADENVPSTDFKSLINKIYQ